MSDKLENILAENMRRFNTKNLDLYDELLLEGSMSIGDKILLAFVVAGSILLGVKTGITHEKQKDRWIKVYDKVKQLDPQTSREIDALIQNFDYSSGVLSRRSSGISPIKDNQIEKKLEAAIDNFVIHYDKEKPNVPDVLDLDDDGNTDELLKNTFK